MSAKEKPAELAACGEACTPAGKRINTKAANIRVRLVALIFNYSSKHLM
jgi:hypothetical protein